MLANCPFFRCFVRAEYLRDHREGHGDYVPAFAHVVTAIPERSLSFQVTLARGDYAGAMFAQMPIQALVTKPCKPLPPGMVQPWDCPSRSCEVLVMEFHRAGRVSLLGSRIMGTYLFTVEYHSSPLADDLEQHKQSHVIALDEGQIVAQPNNRLRWHDPAFFESGTKRPAIRALTRRETAEGVDPWAQWEAMADGVAP